MLSEEPGLNLPELRRYVQRVSDRWPIEHALIGGARVDDAHGALPQRERGPEWVVVLISDFFDGVPWLERVYQAGALWDASEIGGAADVHSWGATVAIDRGHLAEAGNGFPLATDASTQAQAQAPERARKRSASATISPTTSAAGRTACTNAADCP